MPGTISAPGFAESSTMGLSVLPVLWISNAKDRPSRRTQSTPIYQTMRLVKYDFYLRVVAICRDYFSYNVSGVVP